MAYEFNHYYELQNVATGKYVNVLGNHEDGTVKNGEAVNLFNRTNNPDQRWALENCINRREFAICTDFFRHFAGDFLPPCRDSLPPRQFS